MIFLYAACVVVAGVVAPRTVRAIRTAIRHARVARELELIHRAAYRERFGARDRL